MSNAENRLVMPIPVWELAFPNGYGASVIRHPARGSRRSHYEVAVLFGGNIVYDTPVTNDVVGWLDAAGVKKVCGEIRALPPRHPWPGENDNTPGNDIY